MAPRKQWIVAPQAVSSCVTVDGMAQWLCVLDGRWQRKALSAVALCHTGDVNVCWTACSQRHARSRHNPELHHPILKFSPDRKLGECCVALWGCGSAFLDIWIFWRIWSLDMIVYIHIQYQTTGLTAFQKTTAGLFLSSCAAEHIGAASV